MNIIQDIDTAILAMEAIIKFVETIDPHANQYPIIQKIQEAIKLAKEINL